jgi:hypothetical protein
VGYDLSKVNRQGEREREEKEWKGRQRAPDSYTHNSRICPYIAFGDNPEAEEKSSDFAESVIESRIVNRDQ